jgi:OmcA/MtrC family decaheme c-type cytochrome
MRIPFLTGSGVRRAAILALVIGGAVLSSAPGPNRGTKPRFTKHDKAYYKPAAVINFVRPGLVVKIVSASIAQDGTISARFTIQDTAGLPLDRSGVTTPGPVSTSFIAATIPQGKTQYTAYTTRLQTSPITGNSATQAGTDSGGTYTQNGDGDYTYTFKTRAPSGFDVTATHSIGVYASRDLSEFDLGTNYSNDVFNFVPNGSAVTTIRDVVPTEACNQCHDPLSAHGGARQLVALCVLCHTPQTTDPDTGNTVDFKVMIHKIHDGANLPSVVAGGKYQIIGYNQSVNDFSTVVFPDDVRDCTKCHRAPATQADNYLTKPSRAACGSCHDDVNFDTGLNHAGGLAQHDDTMCARCHIPDDGLEFSAGILGAHTIPTMSKALPGVVIGLEKVDNGSAGQSPTVTFTLKNKAGDPLDASKMSRLALVLAGPTTDYTSAISEDARMATPAGDGTYMYTFTATVPADATGTYTIGAEGYNNVTLLPGEVNQMTVRDAAVNQELDFSVDGSPIAPRRMVVDINKCNVCHTSLSVHGNNRNQVKQCVLCHNPTATDADQRPASANPPQGINFAMMIHKIHTGEDLTTDYTIYGFGGSKNNFNDVRFPGDRRDCDKCHVNSSDTPPIGATLAVTDPRGPINPVQPTTSACTGCHTDIAAASHALSNTTVLGEACAVCHGADGEFSVDKVHAR